MAQFHFIEDYERLVAHLVATLPLDEAMSQAVGGSFEGIGMIERDIVRYAGLRDGMSLIDLGCGSGRLAKALSTSFTIDYLGIDIVQALLDYARSICPANYRFLANRALHIPAADNSADMICAFSVFTHLLPEESYIYMEDIRRVLKSAGRLVFSFLELSAPSHWVIFADTVAAKKNSSKAPLNTFVERSVIELWCAKLDFTLVGIVDGSESPWNSGPLVQSVVILEKPSA